MIGYRWYVNTGALGAYERTDFTFPSIEACRYDAEQNYKLNRDCYGINRVEETDDGYITVLEKVQTTNKIEWINDDGKTYFK